MTARPAERLRDPERSREKLLLAGERLFAERGPDAVSVAMIAREARLNRRMVYHYFRSKEGLYETVIRRAYDRLSSVEVELTQVLLPADELLARMVRAYYRFLAGHPEFVRLLSWENLREGRSARRMHLTTLKAPVMQALRIALERGRKEGRFRPDVDEKQLLISCMALSFFYFSNRHTVSQALGVDLARPEAIEERIAHVLSLLMDGIRSGNGRLPRARASAREAKEALA